MYSLDEAQDAILEYLDNEMFEKIIEQSITDGLLVERDYSGELKPYIAVDFGDLAEAGARTAAGPKTYDYALPIRCRVIASDPTEARKIANRLVRKMLGFSTDWSGGVTKSRAAGLFPITTSNMATQAYQMATGFNLTLQLQEY